MPTQEPLEEKEPGIREITRNPDGTFPKGVSGNPSGRPRGTLKDYVRRKFMEMSDEEKEEWIKDNRIPAIDIWRMGEGNPKQDVDVDANITGPSIVRLDE
jgi:hypothetical protein